MPVRQEKNNVGQRTRTLATAAIFRQVTGADGSLRARVRQFSGFYRAPKRGIRVAMWRATVSIISQLELRRNLMHTLSQKIENSLRRAVALSFVLLIAVSAMSAQAQTSRNSNRDYSDSDERAPNASRTRTTNAKNTGTPLGDTPTDILRAARTIYISPNQHINSDYLEYKLDKLPEFGQWQLAIVKDSAKADLVLEIKKTALNYIFSIVEPESSIVVAKGKVVAINGRVAAEDISHQIVKRMRAIRALPAN
jgi:hypothetical protein